MRRQVSSIALESASPLESGSGLECARQSLGEEKVIRAVAMVLGVIYEPQFHPGSYGFRPGRGWTGANLVRVFCTLAPSHKWPRAAPEMRGTLICIRIINQVYQKH